jgi:formamidopyrimidine-DNA glycosylase
MPPRKDGRLKTTLMDQSVIASFGNLLTDEICWRSRMRPTRPVANWDDDDLKSLHATMTQVLRTAVRHGRVPGLQRWLTGVRDDPDRTARAVVPARPMAGWAAGCRCGVPASSLDGLVSR